MAELVGVGDQLHVDGAGKLGVPVVGDAGEEHHAEEQIRNDACDGEGRERAASPARGRLRGGAGAGARGQRELKRVLRGTGGDAGEAGAALD